MEEPDESFNKSGSFKSSTDQNPFTQDSTCSDTIDSSFDYDKWHDPNELIDRLRVLVAERNAGFIRHNNETQFIIEELRKAEIIIILNNVF